jgi:hypothetical protein
MSEQSNIVALTAGGPHAWIMINALRAEFGDFPIILEDGEPQKVFWRRRRKMLGPLKVASMQAARIPLKLTKRGTWPIIENMIEAEGLEPDMPEGANVTRVASVNSDAARAVLQAAKPKAVFVVSTRMIGRKTLGAVDAPFINYHSGINPAYRGMFGGYFALANKEPRVEVQPEDNFHTYLWRMAAGSRDIAVKAMRDAVSGALSPYAVDLPSKQYFAPTLGGYVWTGLSKGVW